MNSAILWFRRDLRLTDNPALFKAMDTAEWIVPLFILSPEEEGPWAMGSASRWWLHHSLKALDDSLRRLGSRLVIRQGDSAAVLRQIIHETGSNQVYWNRLYEPAAIARDKAIKHSLRENGLTVESFNSALLKEPWEVTRSKGEPYKVFTPYWKALQNQWPDDSILPAPTPDAVELSKPIPSLQGGKTVELSRSLPVPRAKSRGEVEANKLASTPLSQREIVHSTAFPPVPTQIEGIALESHGLLPKIAWDGGMREFWQPGEEGALSRLDEFVESAMAGYLTERDRPDHSGTSRLAPHLHFGEIGPRQIACAIRNRHEKVGGQAGADSYLRELGWREFAHHLLYHFPATTEKPMDRRFEHFPWNQPDANKLSAWQQGKTGIPLVDAGMRELWHTGWMHNRVRMVVASFLVKNLRFHWLEGARWFWDTLVDADLANNTLGWQWVAGCGADAAPYFRIFNPVLQGERFDPQGDYVREWVPELSKMPARFIHQPWLAPAAILQSSGVSLGVNYPWPIVDLKTSREQALEAFKQLGNRNSITPK